MNFGMKENLKNLVNVMNKQYFIKQNLKQIYKNTMKIRKIKLIN